MAMDDRLSDLIGKYAGKRGLWLGSGYSSGLVANKPAKWFDRYDFAICANESHKYWTAHARSTEPDWYWICIESSGPRFPWFYHVPDCFTRLSHHKAWEFANPGKAEYMEKLIPVNRNKHLLEDGHFNPREYGDGLHSGELGPSGIAKGTVTMQVMHLACMMGAAHLDMAGVEFCAVNDKWHWYEDLHESLARYVDRQNRLSPHIIRVWVDGKEWWTHSHFLESPPYIDRVYREHIEPAGMSCARFCDSLLRGIPKVEVPA